MSQPSPQRSQLATVLRAPHLHFRVRRLIVLIAVESNTRRNEVVDSALNSSVAEEGAVDENRASISIMPH